MAMSENPSGQFQIVCSSPSWVMSELGTSVSWEPDESASSCFICSGRWSSPTPVQMDFQQTWPWIGPFRTVYLIGGRFNAMSVQKRHFRKNYKNGSRCCGTVSWIGFRDSFKLTKGYISIALQAFVCKKGVFPVVPIGFFKVLLSTLSDVLLLWLVVGRSNCSSW